VCGMTLTGSTTLGMRWDSNVMQPLNGPALEISNQLIQTLEDQATPNEVQFDWSEPGTILVLDNWRMLHARPAVPENQNSRTLYRVFAAE
jgi:alpha-ketoglutarate-dependent taurine dioxygenase